MNLIKLIFSLLTQHSLYLLEVSETTMNIIYLKGDICNLLKPHPNFACAFAHEVWVYVNF